MMLLAVQHHDNSKHRHTRGNHFFPILSITSSSEQEHPQNAPAAAGTAGTTKAKQEAGIQLKNANVTNADEAALASKALETPSFDARSLLRPREAGTGDDLLGSSEKIVGLIVIVPGFIAKSLGLSEGRWRWS